LLLKLALPVLLASSCLGQTTLRQYLNLTNAQATAIVNLNQSYNQYWSSQQQQVDAINNQLSILLTKPAPDPQTLGSLAMQLEMIRRDDVSKQARLQQQVAAQLTAAQVGTVQTLTTAATLQPLVSDAACAYLVKQSFSYWFTTQWFATQVPTLALRSGDFSFISLFPYVAPALPYVPPAPTGSFCGSQVFPISVREYLSLTDSQIAALYAASAAYNDFYVRQQNRLADLNQQIAALRVAGNVDPVVLGQPYAEIARIGQTITDKSNQLRDAALTQLTPAQAAQVTTLQQAQDLNNNNLIYTATGCGLLVLPAASSYYGTAPNGYCPL